MFSADRYVAALRFAAARHHGQLVPGSELPYIVHVTSVAAEVLAAIAGDPVGDPDLAVTCALLHDTIEDTNTTADELRVAFGEVITSVVLEVTDDKSLDRAERKRRQVEHAHELSERAKLVKLADKICNVYDMVAAPPAKWSPERKREYLVWAKDVVDRLRGTHAGLETIFDEVYAKGIRALAAA